MNNRYYNPTSHLNLNPEEEARALDGLARLFSEQAEPSPVDLPLQIVAEANEPMTIRVDIETARVGLGEKKAHLLRAWMVLEEHARTSGRNYVLKADLSALLQSYGVTCCDKTLRRWINKGHDTFWIVTPDRIRLIGYKQVSKTLSLVARATGLRDLVSTNHPGQRRFMYIDVSGSLKQFEAAIYAGWFASRNNPTIARSTLKKLFNRDLSVLREWEQIAGIQVIENFAHYTPDFTSDIPTDENGELRQDVHQYHARGSGQTRWKAQLSNTYVVPTAIRQHPKRGQSRRVFHAIEAVLESNDPTGNCERIKGSATTFNGGLERLGRRYFKDGTKTTASGFAQLSAQVHGLRPRFLLKGGIKNAQRQHEFSSDGKQRIAAFECLPKTYGMAKNG